MDEGRKPKLAYDDIIPARLRELAEKKKESGEIRHYKDIAEQIGVSAAAVTRYLSGNTGLSTDTLVKFARYFDVSADYLLGLDDIPNRTGNNLDDISKYIGLSINDIELLRKDSYLQNMVTGIIETHRRIESGEMKYRVIEIETKLKVED